MTDFKALADAAVRAEVGEIVTHWNGNDYKLPDWPDDESMTAEAFVKDGRIVLALMEKCFHVQVCSDDFETNALASSAGIVDWTTEVSHKDYCVAIVEACLRALGEIE